MNNPSSIPQSFVEKHGAHTIAISVLVLSIVVVLYSFPPEISTPVLFLLGIVGGIVCGVISVIQNEQKFLREQNAGGDIDKAE